MSEKIINKIIQGVGSVASIILHTILFIVFLCLYFLGMSLEKVLLILTTIVSLEAIYLSLFIQMSVNLQAKKIAEIQQDVDDIQEDIEDIQEEATQELYVKEEATATQDTVYEFVICFLI